MSLKDAPEGWPIAPCSCGFPRHCGSGDGFCTSTERALRHWAASGKMPSMTEEQRFYCLSEIGQVEGYRREDYEHNSDRDLARGVLDAWTDYCRDKGLMP